MVNGKVVTIQNGDTLNTVAARINNAGAGVTATVLKVSDTEYRLSLESTATGAAGMSLRNGGSTDILEALKLRDATVTLAHASGSDALSDTYSDSSTAVGSLLSLTSAQSGTINIKGTDVAVNLTTDSLQTIANNINLAAPAGVTASVETVTSGSATSYRLKLTNAAATDLTDSNNILETLGVTKTGATKEYLEGGTGRSPHHRRVSHHIVVQHHYERHQRVDPQPYGYECGEAHRTEYHPEQYPDRDQRLHHGDGNQ